MWLDAFNELRRKSGMSLDDLSAKSGVPKGTLAKITSGITKNPSLETMRDLVYALGYTLDDLENAKDVLPSKNNNLQIREARILAGLSQLDLASKIGVTVRVIQGYETGTFEPKLSNLSAIADICGVSVDFLLGRITEQKKAALPIDSAAEKVSPEQLEEMLVKLGFIQPGEDLSDEDLNFFTKLLDFIDAWFRKNK